MNQFNQMFPAQNQYQRPNPYYQVPTNGINWVQGIEGAKAWQLPPNSNAMLLDSETEGRFYIKVSDNVGMCNLRIFDYTEVTNTPSATTSADLSEYVRKDELQSLLESMLGGMKNEQPVLATEQKRTRTLV